MTVMSNTNKNEGELHIVTEVGVFGDLNINDPSKKKVQKQSDMDAAIAEAIKENAQNLGKK
jgi:hypothetical protein